MSFTISSIILKLSNDIVHEVRVNYRSGDKRKNLRTFFILQKATKADYFIFSVKKNFSF